MISSAPSADPSATTPRPGTAKRLFDAFTTEVLADLGPELVVWSTLWVGGVVVVMGRSEVSSAVVGASVLTASAVLDETIPVVRGLAVDAGAVAAERVVMVGVGRRAAVGGAAVGGNCAGGSVGVGVVFDGVGVVVAVTEVGSDVVEVGAAIEVVVSGGEVVVDSTTTGAARCRTTTESTNVWA